MHLAQSMTQRSITRNTMMLLTAIMLITAVATDATAAERDGGGGGMGEFRGGHLDGGFSPPLLNSVPEMPPRGLYSIHSLHCPCPERDPVSPASPGSIFGNG